MSYIQAESSVKHLTSDCRTPLSLELRFLIACSQTEPDQKDIDFILGALENPTFDTRHLIALSHHHGVLPLLYKTLQNLDEADNIQYLLSKLKPLYISLLKKNMLMTGELIKIMNLFEEVDVEALAFKGPALAQEAYGDITSRQYGDLDILVHKKDFRSVAEIMRANGYTPLYPIETFHGDKVMFEMNNDCPFYDRKRGLAVEIHWDFFRKLALPTEAFFPWKNVETVVINGRRIRTLSRETHLLYHSLHGAKHAWERLIWIVDIDRLIRNSGNLDWDEIISMARKMGAEKMFFSGVALSRRYFSTPLPPSILKRCRNLNLDSFLAYVDSELNRDNPTPENSLTKLAKVIALRDSLRYKAATLLEFLFRPGINERRGIVLSDRWFWLYWPLRPLGMGYRFLFCRKLKLCSPAENS